MNYFKTLKHFTKISLVFFMLGFIQNDAGAQACIENPFANLLNLEDNGDGTCDYSLDICITVPVSPSPKRIEFVAEVDTDNDGTADLFFNYAYVTGSNGSAAQIPPGVYCLSDWGEEFLFTMDCGTNVNVVITGFTNASGGSGGDCSAVAGLVSDSKNELPVELGDFSAQPMEDYNLLTWTSISEINTAVFEVLRSADGENFQIIEVIEAAGNSTEKITYEYLDTKAIPFAYYKLKMVDLDGTAEFSPTIQLKRENETATIAVFPNPVKNNAQVVIESQVNEDAEMLVLDAMGRTIYHGQLEVRKGMNYFPLSLEAQAPGFYQVMISGKTNTISQKVIKLQE